MRDFFKEAREEEQIRQLRGEWFRQRVHNIHRSVTAHDVLRRYGVTVQSDNEEQIRCPFHGSDNKPSARVYPAESGGHSHVWCFVCQEQWDAIALWQKFNHMENDPFTQTLASIERTLGLQIPERPSSEAFRESREKEDREEFQRLYEALERRLLTVRPRYKVAGDMLGYLSASSVLDQVSYGVESKTLEIGKALEVLNQLRERIRAKVRSFESEG